MPDVGVQRWPALRWRKDGQDPVVTVIGMRSTRTGALRRLTPEDVGMVLVRLADPQIGGGRERYAVETIELEVPGV